MAKTKPGIRPATGREFKSVLKRSRIGNTKTASLAQRVVKSTFKGFNK